PPPPPPPPPRPVSPAADASREARGSRGLGDVYKTQDHTHASAPMTRAPAPEYVPETPHHSDWQRPSFHFEGKGAAGGHSATRHASAPATRPQPVE
ncbi:hypothetical protein, partial [Salmonella enterica]|uniref:hypothetical protein n=1 Tax=Salmonella enterica TaxID=28901 RepID=UPI001F450234